jgi:serine/threonine protein kinase
MFDEQGNAFLTDFGIARLLATTTSFTMSGTQIGTPQYMPPEQWDSKADLSQATDQYALAVMTYQLVTGNLPLDGETSMELMHSHIYEPPHPVQAYRPDLPLEIDDVLQKALSKDSNDRYTSTGDFARAFDDAVNLVDIETSTAFFTTLLETPSSTSNRPASRSHRSSQSGSPVQPSQTNAQPKRLLNVVMGIIGIIALIGIGFGLSSAFLGGDSPI